PFSAECSHAVHDAVLFPQNLAPERVDAKIVRWPVQNPKGPQLAFCALGHLYKMDLPDGIPARLTALDAFEFSPSFSADGKRLVFSTWDDDRGAAIRILDL